MPYPPTDHWKESILVFPKIQCLKFIFPAKWQFAGILVPHFWTFDEEIPGFDAFPLEIHRLEDITDITPPRGPASRQSQPPRLTPYMPCCWMMPFTCVDEVKLLLGASTMTWWFFVHWATQELFKLFVGDHFHPTWVENWRLETTHQFW